MFSLNMFYAPVLYPVSANPSVWALGSAPVRPFPQGPATCCLLGDLCKAVSACFQTGAILVAQAGRCLPLRGLAFASGAARSPPWGGGLDSGWGPRGTLPLLRGFVSCGRPAGGTCLHGNLMPPLASSFLLLAGGGQGTGNGSLEIFLPGSPALHQSVVFCFFTSVDPASG